MSEAIGLADLQGLDAEHILRVIEQRFEQQVVFATSFSAEDQVITDLLSRNHSAIPIITLDTGRLFPETYQLWAETERYYGVRVQGYFPDAAAVEKMIEQNGINGFYDAQEKRKHCCRVRKLDPLRRALSPYRAWICGLRREQSITRAGCLVAEKDVANGLYKINPLSEWSEQQVWGYIAARQVPYNSLHDRGFTSIGCACCTRAVKRTEDARAGRWWWEQSEQKECGLHRVQP